MLVAEGLHKRYGSVVALDGFDLSVAAGEVVGLIGRNGAGKSTFAAIAAGILRPDRGTVSVDGIDVRQARACIGVISGGAELVFTLRNVEFTF